MKKPYKISKKIRKNLPRTSKIQSIPGTGGYVGEKREESVKLQVLGYDENKLIDKELSSVDEILSLKEDCSVTWLNVTGVHDEAIIRTIGQRFDIHPLVLEDIADTTRRPKFEEYDDYLFIVLKMINMENTTNDIVMEQVSLIVGRDYVISFQERGGSS